MSATFNSIYSTGLSGLRATQAAIGVASQNISNANTPGYVRAEIQLSPRSNFGVGQGVEVTGVRRAADQFLAAASYIAEATRGSSAVRADVLGRAQAAFGDPTSSASIFSTLGDFWASLESLSVDPSSSLRRNEAITALETTYSELETVGTTIQSLISETDQRIADAVSEVQNLIDHIAELNNEIRLTQHVGADPSAAQNAQSELVDRLSELIDVRVSPQSNGGLFIRTSGGGLLVGAEAAQLSYTAKTGDFATQGVITINPDLGTQSNLEQYISGGRLAGLLQLRDQDLPALAEGVGGLAGELADALNKVHNENVGTPAPSSLVGRQTGLVGDDALNFTGIAIVGVTDSDGALAQRLTIDFDNGQIVGAAPAATYTFANNIDAFTTALNTALGAATPAGSATFTNGALSLSVSGGGVLVQQDSVDPNVTGDTATPSDRAGRGFAHFFGLNDIVQRDTPLFFETGLSSTDLHHLQSGGELSFQITDSDGRYITQRTVAISGALTGATSTWGDVVTALNATGTGIGGFGSFQLNATTGRLELTENSGYKIELLGDSTQRGATGVSLTALNGLSERATAGRAIDLSVDSDVLYDTGRLSLGRPNIHTAIGQQLIEAGDNRGAFALLSARDTSRDFPAAGVMSAQSTSLELYASRLGGEAGRLAASASREATGAEAVASAAFDRRAQVEGVNLDDELLKMTQYQNAYAAAARLIQAATEMLDTLLSIGR